MPAAAQLDRWLELKSPHFTISGDVPDRELRDTAEALEAFTAALGPLYGAGDPAQPTRVVVFRDPRQFARFLPRDEHGRPQQNVSGYFLPYADANFIVLAQQPARDTRQVVLHEYAHHLIRRSVRPLPLWLNEGLAEFYSTFERDPSLAAGMIGRPRGELLAELRDNEFVPLERILRPLAPADLLSDGHRARMFYAESWALVHYLTLGRPGSGPRQMRALIDALTRGVPTEQAFIQAVGMGIDQLDGELRKYVRRETFGGAPVRDGAAAPLVSSATAMAASAVMALHGELLFRVGAVAEAGDVLGAALALDPANAEARLAMARVSLAQGDRSAGLDALEQVATRAPASFAAQYYLGGLLAVDRNYAGAFRCFDAAVRLRPNSVPGLYAFSTVALALGLDDAAEEAMQLAMRLESNPEAYRLRAYTALGLRRDTVAARDALRYIESVGWHDDEATETAFVAAIANLRSQRRGEAAAILERVRASVSTSSWAAAVVDFLEGRLGGERLLGLAKDVEQQTEAHTYIGLAARLAGRDEEARAHFQWVKNAGTRRELEYGVAIEELVRIEMERRQRP